MSTTCAPNHVTGSRPWGVPVAGIPGTYVVRHGDDYLDKQGHVATQTVVEHMTWSEAEFAIVAHELAVSGESEYVDGFGRTWVIWKDRAVLLEAYRQA